MTSLFYAFKHVISTCCVRVVRGWTAVSWMTNVIDDTGETVVIRGCALDSGTLTTDTEIIRMSHCGGLYFNDR